MISLYHRRVHTNISTLTRNIRFIAESLAKYVYALNAQELDIFEGSLSVNQRFIETWLQALTESSRVTPYLSSDSALISGLEKVHLELASQTLISLYALFLGIERLYYRYKQNDCDSDRE